MSARRDRALYVLAFIALCGAALLPIWRARLIPLLDQPNHLAAIQVWNKLADSGWGFQRFYDYSRVPVPYWGYYLPVHLLSYVFDIEIANKLFLSAYVVSLPLSIFCCARALGTSRVAALLVIPFAFNDSWAWGFLSYVPGVSLLFFALAVLVAYFRAPSIGRATGFFVLVMATYFMHLLPWAALCVFAVLYSLGQWPKRRAVVTSWLLVVLSAVFCAADTIYCSQTARTVRKSLVVRAAWENPLDSTKRFFGRLISWWPDGHGDTIALGLLLLAIVLLVATQPRRRAAGAWHAFIAEHFVGLSVVVAIVLYYASPVKLIEPVWIWHVNTRYAVLVPLFLVLAIDAPLTNLRRALVAIAVAASLYYPVALSSHYLAFNARAKDLFPVLAQIPRGSSTLTLLFGKNDDPALDDEYVPWNEFHSYPEVFSGGFDPYGWTLGFPYVVKEALPVPRWNDPSTFRQATHGRFFDYVLTRNEWGDKAAFGGVTSQVTLVAHTGAWRLYRTRDVPR